MLFNTATTHSAEVLRHQRTMLPYRAALGANHVHKSRLGLPGGSNSSNRGGSSSLLLTSALFGGSSSIAEETVDAVATVMERTDRLPSTAFQEHDAAQQVAEALQQLNAEMLDVIQQTDRVLAQTVPLTIPVSCPWLLGLVGVHVCFTAALWRLLLFHVVE